MKLMRKLHSLLFVVLFFAPTGCAITTGIIYEDVGQPPLSIVLGARGPSIDFDPSLNSAINGRSVLKKGRACSRDVLKLVAWGDGTQAAAAKAGGITKITGVDFEVTAVLGIVYTQSCTIVYGE